MFLLPYLGESVVAPNPIAKVSPHVHREKGKGRNIQVLLPRRLVVRRGGGEGGGEGGAGAQFVQVQKTGHPNLTCKREKTTRIVM